MKNKTLEQLQANFYQDVVGLDDTKNYLNNGNFTGTDLIQIYRNQYFMSLSETLGKSYACVKRLVGEDFFNTLAIQFIKTQPSKTGNIIDYGDGFSNFISHHAHCQTLPYLADVARFERLYEVCYFSSSEDDNVFFIESNYPIIKIWQLDENSEALDFSSGGEYIKIYKRGVKVVVESMGRKNAKNN